jgi:hypothetical protein
MQFWADPHVSDTAAVSPAYRGQERLRCVSCGGEFPPQGMRRHVPVRGKGLSSQCGWVCPGCFERRFGMPEPATPTPVAWPGPSIPDRAPVVPQRQDRAPVALAVVRELGPEPDAPALTGGADAELLAMARRLRALLQEMRGPALQLGLTGLTASEGRVFDALYLGALHAPGWVTREYLLLRVWGPSYAGEFHLLRVNIARLRPKLAPIGWAIETSAGRGYRLVEGDGGDLALPEPEPEPARIETRVVAPPPAVEVGALPAPGPILSAVCHPCAARAVARADAWPVRCRWCGAELWPEARP